MKQYLLLPLLLVCLISANPAVPSTPSVNATSENHRQEERFRYVNAARLNLREEPSTTAAILLVIKSPSVVKVLEDDGEWSLVSIVETTGYVKSSYLVSSIDEITVSGIDLEHARQNHGLTYTEAAPVIARPSKGSGARVFYCASGNVVKYHSSSSCRGLSRCRASIDPISLSEAQASMDPCKICY